MSIQKEIPHGWKSIVSEFRCWTAGIDGVELRYSHGLLHISIPPPVGNEPDYAELIDSTREKCFHTCEVCGAPGQFGAHGHEYRIYGVRCGLHSARAGRRAEMMSKLQADLLDQA